MKAMLRPEMKKHNMDTKAYTFGMLNEVRPEFALNLVDLADITIANFGYIEPGNRRLRC